MATLLRHKLFLIIGLGIISNLHTADVIGGMLKGGCEWDVKGGGSMGKNIVQWKHRCIDNGKVINACAASA